MLYFKGIQYFRENLFWFCVCVRDWSGGGGLLFYLIAQYTLAS